MYCNSRIICIVKNVWKTNKTAVRVDAFASVCACVHRSRVISSISLVCHSSPAWSAEYSRSRPEDVIRPAFAVGKNSAPILEILSPFWPGIGHKNLALSLGTSEQRGENRPRTWPIQSNLGAASFGPRVLTEFTPSIQLVTLYRSPNGKLCNTNWRHWVEIRPIRRNTVVSPINLI